MDTPEDQETKRRKVEQEKGSKVKDGKCSEVKGSREVKQKKEAGERLSHEMTEQDMEKVESCVSCKESNRNSDLSRDKKSPSLSPTAKRRSQPLAEEEESSPKFRFKMSRDTLRLIREAGKKFTQASTDGNVSQDLNCSPGEGAVRRFAREVEGRWGKVKVPVRIFLYEPHKPCEESVMDESKSIKRDSLTTDKVTETAEKDTKSEETAHAQSHDAKTEGVIKTSEETSVCDDSSQDQEELTVKDLVGKFEGAEEESDNGKAKLRRSKSSVDDLERKVKDSPPKRYSLQSVPKSNQSPCDPGNQRKGHIRSSSHGDPHGRPSIKISPDREPDPTSTSRVPKKFQGKSHPLSKLTPEGRSKNPFYNTM